VTGQNALPPIFEAQRHPRGRVLRSGWGRPDGVGSGHWPDPAGVEQERSGVQEFEDHSRGRGWRSACGGSPRISSMNRRRTAGGRGLAVGSSRNEDRRVAGSTPASHTRFARRSSGGGRGAGRHFARGRPGRGTRVRTFFFASARLMPRSSQRAKRHFPRDRGAE